MEDYRRLEYLGFTGDERKEKSSSFARLLANQGLIDGARTDMAAHAVAAFCDQGPLPVFCLYFRSDTGIPDWKDVAEWGFNKKHPLDRGWIEHHKRINFICDRLMELGVIRKIGPEENSGLDRLFLSGCAILILKEL